MRKHFLILMLMALLPLAGWAVEDPTEYTGEYPVDLSDGWAIELVPPTATYTGEVQTPVVRLRKGNVFIPSTKFTVTWGEGNRKDVSNVGYTVTVTNDMTNTIKTLSTPTAEFWILKANNTVSAAPTMASPATVNYSGSEFTFVATKGTATFGNVEFIVSADEPAANAAGWSTDSPKATNPGTYKVWYRAPGTSNYNASDPVALGTFVIDGNDPVVTTLPQAIPSLTYNGTAKNLITAGVVSTTPTLNGKLWYRYKLHTASAWSNWDMNVPQATNGGDYDVQWKLVGETGYDNIDAQDVAGVSIAAATVTISTEPTKATGLTYNGESRALITSEGVAGLNAPVTYTVTYKAPNATDFSAFLPAGTAYADVKATNAGTYRVVASVVASANFNAVSGNNNDVVIAQAKAFETAPSAKDLRYTGLDQVLIQEAEGTAPGVIEYKLGTDDYTTAIASIKASAVASYTVKYKVTNTNYQPVAETTIENVKIKGALLTVKINDITKVYDGSTDIVEAVVSPATPANYTVDGDKDRVEFISTLAGYTTTGAALNYAAVTQKDYKEGGYPGVLTIDEAAYKTANPNFDINFIKGKLTIAQKELYVTAKDQAALTTKVGDAYTLGDKYDVTGIVNTENPWATDKAPVLTSNAPNPLVAGEYTLSFTPGTLNTTDGKNYKMRSENPYVIPAGLKFKVNPADGSKVVITILPHDKYYGDADPDFTKWENGTDYYISGLITGDEVQNLTFSRSAGETVAGGPYALTATATLKNPTWYDESLAIVPSTFTIKPKVLTATVAQQIVVKDATVLPDPTAWEVEGLVDATINGVEIKDTKADLGGTLAMSTTAAPTTEGTITLAITNPNYTLKTGTNVGVLIVIDDATFVLNPNDANFVDLINAAGTTEYKITFMDQTKATYNGETTTNVGFTKTLKAGQWNTLVLPFSTTVEEVSAALGYAVVDVLDESNDNPDAIKLKLAFNELPAHKPFLVQPKVTKKLSEVNFWNSDSHKKALVAVPPVAKAEDGAEHAFVGQYTDYKVMPENKNEYFYSSTDKAFRNAKEGGSGTWINIFGAYLLDGSNKARVITIQEADGSTTAISTINADGIAVPAEGWYTLNGVKLQGVPTEKGIYIHNGKKLVVK